MGLAGRLEGMTPADIFQIISQSRMTGTLIARCPDGTAMVVFKNGQVVEAASDAPQESLGHFLASKGLVNEKKIEAAQERWKLEPERPLGAILVEMGAITDEALETVVRGQIGQIVHRLMSCDDGFITFDRGETAVRRKLHTREFFLPSGVSAEFLIMERARAADEERRSGVDRRRSQAPGAAAAGATGERRRAGDVQPVSFGGRMSAKAGAAIRAIKLQKTFEAVIRIGARIAGPAKTLFQRHALPRLKTVWSRIGAFSPDGKAMIFAGLGGIAAGLCLILLTTVSFSTSGGDLVITGKVVKLRAKPSTTAKVVTKINQGETVLQLTMKEGWYKVKTKTGNTGWVWKNLISQQEKKGLAFNYRVRGFEVILLGGGALLVVGILRRRKNGKTVIAAAPGKAS